jgi:AAA domain
MTDIWDDIAAKIESENGESPPGDQKRRIVLSPASTIRPRRVRWLWNGRLALGTLALLAGREGLGKSILAYTVAAMITRGMLPGEHSGTPRAVLIAATEDSWAQTIVPRLIAADADLDLVYKVEILSDGVHRELDLPVDLVRVREAVEDTRAVLLILDPLLSRLSDRLDTHKDAEVRLALEPMVALAELIDISIWGLIHHNKSATSDPLQAVISALCRFEISSHRAHRPRRRHGATAAIRHAEEQPGPE